MMTKECNHPEWGFIREDLGMCTHCGELFYRKVAKLKLGKRKLGELVEFVIFGIDKN